MNDMIPTPNMMREMNHQWNGNSNGNIDISGNSITPHVLSKREQHWKLDVELDPQQYFYF
jgi:hypothetical protein